MVGRLPFDDTNHKKLLKMVLAGPVFPSNKEMSPEFQDLVVLILKQEDSRLWIPQIRVTPWFQIYAR